MLPSFSLASFCSTTFHLQKNQQWWGECLDYYAEIVKITPGEMRWTRRSGTVLCWLTVNCSVVKGMGSEMAEIVGIIESMARLFWDDKIILQVTIHLIACVIQTGPVVSPWLDWLRNGVWWIFCYYYFCLLFIKGSGKQWPELLKRENKIIQCREREIKGFRERT